MVEFLNHVVSNLILLLVLTRVAIVGALGREVGEIGRVSAEFVVVVELVADLPERCRACWAVDVKVSVNL